MPGAHARRPTAWTVRPIRTRVFYTDPRAWPPWLRAIDRTVPYLTNLYPPDGGSPAISGIHMSGVREYYRTFERIRALDPLHVMPGNDPAIGERELYP